MKTYRTDTIELLTRDILEITEQERHNMSAKQFRYLCGRLADAALSAKDHFAMTHFSCDGHYMCSVMYDEIDGQARLVLFRDIVTEPVVLRRYSLEVPDEG